MIPYTNTSKIQKIATEDTDEDTLTAIMIELSQSGVKPRPKPGKIVTHGC